VRILAMMEAASVTGPAKNLLGFCRWLDTPEGAGTGLSVVIATFDRNARAYESDGFAAAARAAGVETHLLRERYRFDPGVLPQLRAYVAAIQPDIIQTHNGKSHLLMKLAPGLRRGRLWFAFQHGYTHTDIKQRLYNQLDRLSLRAADRVVSVCQAFAPRLVAYGVRPERIRVLHNAVAPARTVAFDEQSRLRSQLGIGNGDAVILAVGRLSQEKGHTDLLRALALLPRGEKVWRFVLVGAGPEREALERLTRTLGLTQHVVFAGFHADVAAYFAIANIFVLPSHTEGSSNVLLEAMMAGVPIVATRAGGNGEIVLDGKTGLLVPVGEPQAMADAVARLLIEPYLASQFADAAGARARQEFSLERYRVRLSGYYSEALAATRRDTGSPLYPAGAE
jgi:glycosyltransferase involved in cell wall biosynthesis